MVRRSAELTRRTEWLGAARFPSGWRLRADELRRSLTQLEAHPTLRRISTPERLSIQHVQAARLSRQPGFKAIARWAQLYIDLFVTPGLGTAALLDRLATFLLIPNVQDKFFELVVLARTDTTIRSRGFRRTRARLVGGGQQDGTSIEYQGRGRLRVYYQAVPSALSTQSAYASVLDAHAVPWRQRTPDVIVAVPMPEAARYLMIEAKFSNREATIRDGLYQTFGYHADFAFPLGVPADTMVVSLLPTREVPTDRIPVALVPLERFATVLDEALARSGA